MNSPQRSPRPSGTPLPFPTRQPAVTPSPIPTVSGAAPVTVDIDLPSASTGASGGTLAVRLFAPSNLGSARHPEGAPVVIFAPGGDSPGALDVVLAQATDVIRIVFLFPGGEDQQSGRRSSGSYDFRGTQSIAALRDVILYAAGLRSDKDGKRIDEAVPVRVQHRNIGLFGSSNGGNIILAAAALHGTEFNPFVRYFIQWESPTCSQIAVGDVAPVRLACLNGQQQSLPTANPWYSPAGNTLAELAVDYSKVRFNPADQAQPLFLDGNGDGRYTTRLDPLHPGCQTPDLNGDGRLTTGEDYPLKFYRSTNNRLAYSRQATQAFARFGVFSNGQWPANLLTVEEANAFWDLREASQLFERALNAMPQLEGMFLASLIDHVQTTLTEKAHAQLTFYNLYTRGKWIKLNPSRSYLTALEARFNNRSDLPDNPANVAPNWNDPASYAYPDDVDATAQAAAVQEMSDRARQALLPPPPTPTPVVTPTPVSTPTPKPTPRPTPGNNVSDYAIFSINTQDFAYPELSITTIRRILDLHEQYGVPVDIYLDTTMTDFYEQQAPDLLQRLRTSTIASVSYHIRPPKPYYNNYDWAGLGAKSAQEQYQTVLNYETHGLDLRTGQPTNQAGGYQKLSAVMGYVPYVAAMQPDASVGQAVSDVFKDLGARFFIQHERVINLGDRLNGVYLRPEHYDLRLFQTVGQDAATVIENAFASAHTAAGARAPYFVGVKMHDNDFFAEDSAWVTVYVNGPRRPPFDTSRQSPLLSEAQQQAVWQHYEAAVAYVAAQSQRLGATNAPRLWQLLAGAPTPTPTPTPAPAGNTRLYVSGTMHIETNRNSWPNVDQLLAFFERATATGMKWSVGADIGWLQGEPRAAEAIRRLEALGVEMDVHAHELADRANCFARLTQLGGHPNQVASGLIFSELDALRSPIRGTGNFSGTTWQAEVVWGIVLEASHGPGADDYAVGVWRPRSSGDWKTHDPNGRLIAVGGGNHLLPDTENYANRLRAATQPLPPVLSTTIMVSPRTFTIVNTSDGIASIENWAARMTANPLVRWATISQTAAAWVAAGGIPSRNESWRQP